MQNWDGAPFADFFWGRLAATFPYRSEDIRRASQ